MRIPDHILDRIRRDSDLIDLLKADGHDVRVQGRNKGSCLCPFHPDKRIGNFSTYFDKSGNPRFKCFACGASGDAINYIQEAHHLDFLAAAKYLANLLHITLPAS